MLAHLSHFIIAVLTDPSSVQLELETILPTLPKAVQPILEHGNSTSLVCFQASLFAIIGYSRSIDIPTLKHCSLI